jgi:hypothetical protein
MTFAPPPFLVLAGEDVPAHLPVEEHQLAIDREGRPELGLPDAVLETPEELLIALRRCLGQNRRRLLGFV